MTERPLSIGEAAEAMNVSRRTVWRLIHDGRVRTLRIRGRTLIEQREIDAFLKSARAA